MTKDDSITLKVKNMYKKYPYPSPQQMFLKQMNY